MKVYMASTNSPIQKGDEVQFETNINGCLDVIHKATVISLLNPDFHFDSDGGQKTYLEVRGFIRKDSDSWINIAFWIEPK
jgi:hypothetical protein